MKCAEIIENETTVAVTTNTVRFPAGLLGFEQIKDYLLVANPTEQPFAWLKVADNTGLAFVVINPFIVVPDYQPDIPAADATFLGLSKAEDAILIAIVTIQDNQAAMNLKGPIVINRHTHIAKQVIVTNAAKYSVQHPLPMASADE